MTLASMSNHRKNVHEHNKRREDSPFRARGNYAAQGAQDPDHGRTTRITHVTRDPPSGRESLLYLLVAMMERHLRELHERQRRQKLPLATRSEWELVLIRKGRRAASA